MHRRTDTPAPSDTLEQIRLVTAPLWTIHNRTSGSSTVLGLMCFRCVIVIWRQKKMAHDYQFYMQIRHWLSLPPFPFVPPGVLRPAATERVPLCSCRLLLKSQRGSPEPPVISQVRKTQTACLEILTSQVDWPNKVRTFYFPISLPKKFKVHELRK